MREAAIARGAVQNEIETLRVLPFSQLADRENAPFASAGPELKALVRATPSVTIRTRPEDGLKEVDASVRWRGDNGRWIEKRLTTLIADKEPR